MFTASNPNQHMKLIANKVDGKPTILSICSSEELTSLFIRKCGCFLVHFYSSAAESKLHVGFKAAHRLIYPFQCNLLTLQ